MTYDQAEKPTARLHLAGEADDDGKAGTCASCRRDYGEAAVLVDAGPRSTCPRCRCPGICNRDWRQASPTLARTPDATAGGKDLPPGLVPVQGQPVWCVSCSVRIARSLLSLPEAFAHLELDKLHGTQAGGEHVSGSKAPPSPSPKADVQDDVVRWLTSWEDAVRELRGDSTRPARLAHPRPQAPMASAARDCCPWPRERYVADRRMARAVQVTVERRETVTLTGVLRYLVAHLEWALAHEDIAVDLGREILREASTLRRLTRLDAQRVRKPVPCPRCQLKTLVHEGGDSYVGCQNPECGRLLSLDEYDEHAADHARDAKRVQVGA